MSVKKTKAVKKPAAKSRKAKAPAGANDTRVSALEKNKGGRPEIQPDTEVLRNLLGMQCTQAEIACALGVSRKTVERWAQRADLRELFLEGRELGKVSVRRQQFKLLDAGSVAMAIWLGKQLLGQKDEVKVETNENAISYAGLLGIIDRLDQQRGAEPDPVE